MTQRPNVVNYLYKNDIVFLYHKWAGIVAAGKVTSGVKADAAAYAHYRDLEWLTPKPLKSGGDPRAMSPGEIKAVLGHDFFWARTIKSPYLSKEESVKLLDALKHQIGLVT